LYPEQSGRLVIDPMQIRNQIEFDDPLLSNNKKKLEKILNSSPVIINVKELPANKPSNYSGAVGRFTIEADINKNKLAVNQQGRLIIRIKGKGNFTQFTIPQVLWPTGFDVFEPAVNEHQDKSIVPMIGSSEYVFNFVHDSAGKYVIPPIAFSFFDPVLRTYKTIQTDPINIEILPAVSTSVSDQSNNTKSRNILLWILIPILLLIGFIFYWKRKPVISKNDFQTKSVEPSILSQLNELDLQKLQGKQACHELQKLIKRVYFEKTLTAEQKTELQLIEKDCQLMAYSDISESFDKEELRQRLMRVLGN
jgi:hypothetical protein